ncbi:MAG: hypothetical protein P4L79_10210 [Legionella sp.]|uniref:hypothetical protein n=1 Tax=Legionella sp. TaxID=459 RepID=UPI002845242B|nr:hypothetical protein [Legionella sp.]
MFFYHGTNKENIDSIAVNGIRPRNENENKDGTWGGMSNNECVYLTTDIDKAEVFAGRFKEGVVLQVVVEEDNQNLRVDDNFLYYEDRAMDWNKSVARVTQDKRWKESIEKYKLCAHIGTIEPEKVIFVKEVKSNRDYFY